MRNTLIIICFGLLLLSCGENARNTKITGKLDNSASETAYLQELTVTGDGAQDSVKLSGSGKFKFTLKINQPAFYKLRIGNQ
ncbi:MAG TPA: DUF4369 domain-containing protein, partial [Bacteroidales bacterium]|nr:DUF4369 domain-containing protein [Bacteroidales bacterium]